MMSIVEPNANDPSIKRGIHHTRIFCQLTHQSLLMRPIPWKQTTSSTHWSPSLGCYTVWSIRRLCTQYNNSEAQLEPGGPPTQPLYLLIITLHGASSVLLSVLMTYLQVCSIAT
jgi:hypothetical protein